MKQKALKILFSCLLCTTALYAEMSFAQKVSYDLVKSILGTVLGSEMSKLFGEGALTKEDLDKSLDEHFSQFGFGLYEDEVRTLKERIYDFSPKANTLRASGVDSVLEATENLAAKIDNVMNEQTFWEVMPTYIYLSNIRLAFLAQKSALDPQGGWEQTMAENAVRAMDNVRKYWMKFMVRKEGNLACLYKEPYQKYFVEYMALTYPMPTEKVSVELNPLSPIIKKYDALIDVRVCKSDIMIKKYQDGYRKENPILANNMGNMGSMEDIEKIRNSVPADAFFNAKRVFNTPMPYKRESTINEWWFVYKKPNSDGQHWIEGPYNSKEAAQEQRFRLSYFSYDDELGPLRHTISQWHDIAQRFGDNTTKRDANLVFSNY